MRPSPARRSAAGLNKEGAKNVVCLTSSRARCSSKRVADGIKDTFKGKVEVLYVTGYDMPTVRRATQAKLQQDPSIDYVVTLGAPFAPVVLDAVKAAGTRPRSAPST